MKKLISQLRIPLIQAPMAGYSTPSFVAAAANEGIVGSFGFAYSPPEKIDQDLQKARKLSPKGIMHANFFVFNKNIPLPSEEVQKQCLDALKELPPAAKLSLSLPEPPYYHDLEAQLEPVWKHKPQLLSFHFGLPPQEVLDRARKEDILVGVTATSMKEIKMIELFGPDYIIMQGIEAGGHQGSFLDNDNPENELPLDVLIEEVKLYGKLPIVAAGGLMTGADITRVINHAAVAAQMGTVFLTCREAGTSKAHRELLLKGDRPTELVRGFSGRKARGIKNEFMEKMKDKPYLPFPIQNTITGAIRKAATEQGNAEYQSLWAGVNYKHCKECNVKELVDKLEKEFRESGPRKT